MSQIIFEMGNYGFFYIVVLYQKNGNKQKPPARRNLQHVKTDDTQIPTTRKSRAKSTARSHIVEPELNCYKKLITGLWLNSKNGR